MFLNVTALFGFQKISKECNKRNINEIKNTYPRNEVQLTFIHVFFTIIEIDNACSISILYIHIHNFICFVIFVKVSIIFRAIIDSSMLLHRYNGLCISNKIHRILKGIWKGYSFEIHFCCRHNNTSIWH